MLYLIGGPPRTGKSALGLAMLRAHGVPWLSTDVLRQILRHVVPEIDAVETGPVYLDGLARVMHPFVEQLAELCLAQTPRYLIEGVEIVPRDIAGYRSRFGQVRACFLGDSLASADGLRDYRGENPWHQVHDHPELEGMATLIRDWSERTAEECQELGFDFIDVGRIGFEGMLERGGVILVGPGDP